METPPLITSRAKCCADLPNYNILREHTHTHTVTQTHSHTNTPSQKHTVTPTHTHSHTHTNTHTYVQSPQHSGGTMATDWTHGFGQNCPVWRWVEPPEMGGA